MVRDPGGTGGFSQILLLIIAVLLVLIGFSILTNSTIQQNINIGTRKNGSTPTITDYTAKNKLTDKDKGCLRDFDFNLSEPCIKVDTNKTNLIITYDDFHINLETKNNCYTDGYNYGQVIKEDRILLSCNGTYYVIDTKNRKVLTEYSYGATGFGENLEVFENKPVAFILVGYENRPSIVSLINIQSGETVSLKSYGSTRYNDPDYWFNYEPYEWLENGVQINFLKTENITPYANSDYLTTDDKTADNLEDEIENDNKNKYIDVVCHLGARYTGIGSNDGCFGLKEVQEYIYYWD